MLILKPKARASEWVLSIGLFFFGLALSLTPSEKFIKSAYGSLTSILSQPLWITLIISVALFRLTILVIDLKAFSLPHLRAAGTLMGIVIWSSLFSAVMTYRFTGAAIYGTLLIFEFMALWWAAGDAKLVDKESS